MKLVHHNVTEWATIIQRRLLDLGCSVEYAQAAHDSILSAAEAVVR